MKVRAALPEFANRIAEISNAPCVEQGYRRFPNHPVRSVTRRKMAPFEIVSLCGEIDPDKKRFGQHAR
jgi:hypothetical protein